MEGIISTKLVYDVVHKSSHRGETPTRNINRPRSTIPQSPSLNPSTSSSTLLTTLSTLPHPVLTTCAPITYSPSVIARCISSIVFFTPITVHVLTLPSSTCESERLGRSGNFCTRHPRLQASHWERAKSECEPWSLWYWQTREEEWE